LHAIWVQQRKAQKGNALASALKKAQQRTSKEENYQNQKRKIFDQAKVEWVTHSKKGQLLFLDA